MERKRQKNERGGDPATTNIGLNIKQSQAFHRILNAKKRNSPLQNLNKKKWLYKNRSVDEKQFRRKESDMREHKRSGNNNDNHNEQIKIEKINSPNRVS